MVWVEHPSVNECTVAEAKGHAAEPTHRFCMGLLLTKCAPPCFSEPVAAAVREESFMLRLALNEAGTAWYTVVNAGREPPSAAEVRSKHQDRKPSSSAHTHSSRPSFACA